MALYVPPHKRHSNGLDMPTLLVPEFRKRLHLGSSSRGGNKGGKIIYASGSVSRWFALGVDEDGNVPSYVELKPVPVESFVRRMGKKPLALVKNELAENCEKLQLLPSYPWEYIAVNVWPDLLSSFDFVMREVNDISLEKVRPNLLARIGKVLFKRGHSAGLGTVGPSSLSVGDLGQRKLSFYTNIPMSYADNIVALVVPKIGVHFEEEKDIYHIKLSDSTRPDSTISCKCTVNKDDGKLRFYKIELNQVRQLVVDIILPSKGFRFKADALQKEDSDNFDGIIDPYVKEGVRWPLDKDLVGERFKVVGIWHTVSSGYSSSLLRLRKRQADRYDFKTETGVTSVEVVLKLKGVTRELKEKNFDAYSIPDGLKDGLKIIWENFLDFSHFLK